MKAIIPQPNSKHLSLHRQVHQKHQSTWYNKVSFCLSLFLSAVVLCLWASQFLSVSGLTLHLWPAACQAESNTMSSEITFTPLSISVFLPHSLSLSLFFSLSPSFKFYWMTLSSHHFFIATCVFSLALLHTPPPFPSLSCCLWHVVFFYTLPLPLYLILVSRPHQTPSCAKWTGRRREGNLAVGWRQGT